jgi:hypothetical protein
MMRLHGVAAVIALGSLCCGIPAHAQDDVTVNYSGGSSTTWIGPNPDFILGSSDVDAGIYNGTVSGVPGAHPGIVCDDYSGSVSPGETWTATALDAASLNSKNIDQTMFGSLIGLEGYAEVATLVSYMFNGHSGYSQAELSSAIWYITSVGNPILSLRLWLSLDANAQGLVLSLESEFGGKLAAAETALAGFSNLWILTPTTSGPQEMWVQAAEGGAAALYLLLAGFSCFGALYWKRRRTPGMQPMA